MGYPMTYRRVVNRNRLQGDYDRSRVVRDYDRSMVAGDLRRLEEDQRDDNHLARYAAKTGLTTEQVKSVLDLFLSMEDALYG